MSRRGVIAGGLIALATLGVILPSRAEEVAFNPPALGTRLYLASGGYLELDSVDGTVIRTVNAGYGVQPWFAACFEPGRGVEIDDFASIDALWPLVIGKQASFRARRQELQWEETL